jgi:glycine cleavage system H protein
MPELRFSPAHMWARREGDTAVLGVTDFFQDQMGDITALDLADIGDYVRASRRMGRIESEEASSPLESPVTGEVVDVNNEALTSPDVVNAEPYESGWLLKVRLEDPSELDELMTEEEYTELTAEV